MAIASRAALIDYALRALGEDVVEINVSEDQCSDRLDEALEWFRDYHSDGVEKVYLKHQITGTKINLGTGDATLFGVGETITAGTSGVTFVLHSATDSTQLVTKRLDGTLTPGEALVGATTGAIASVGSIGSPAVADVVLGDFDQKSIPVTDAIIGVNRILAFTGNNSSGDWGMFDVRYQIMLNDMFSLTNVNMLYYTQVQSHLSMINFLLTPDTSIQFNRHQDRLFLNFDWNTKVSIGQYVIVEAWAILDPEQWVEVYNDRILKEYYIALLKRQWGNNLKKFEGMQLPGGVTLNGQKIYDEAMVEIEEIRNRIVNSHQLPVDFMVG
jgi:hypothetical protein